MDGEIEMRGVLEQVSNRFYSRGWGFGTLLTEKGPIKIVGTLEGHVAGTSLIVRGTYKDSAYGRQLDCSSIIVDSVSGDLTVVRGFLRKNKALRDHETEILFVVRDLTSDERWIALQDAGVLQKLGLERELARIVETEVTLYFVLITTKRGLMEQGLTDKEADALVLKYHTDAVRRLREDPWGIVVARVLAFQRVEAVVGRHSYPRVYPRRLQAAVVQALAGQLRNGHTAVPHDAVMREAANIASVYPDAVARAPLPWEAVMVFGDDLLQLKAAGYAEADIAAWITGIKRDPSGDAQTTGPSAVDGQPYAAAGMTASDTDSQVGVK